MATTTDGRAAFDEAILQLQPSLLHLALGLTRDAGEARDLVQDALERAMREWTRFTPGTNARAWVSAILSRLFIDRWRRRKRQPRFVDLDRADVMGPCGPSASEWAASLPGDAPPSAPWEAVTDADLTAAVDALPAKLRVVFDLSVGERCSYLEISRATGIPVNTVGTRLLRARRHLRATLEARIASRAAVVERAGTLVPAPGMKWVPRLGLEKAARRPAVAGPFATPPMRSRVSPTESPDPSASGPI